MLLNDLTGETDLCGSGVHILLTLDGWMMAEQLACAEAMRIMAKAVDLDFGFRTARALVVGGAEGYRRRHAHNSPALTDREIDQLFETYGLLKISTELVDCIQHSQALGFQQANVDAEESAKAPLG